MFHHVSLDPKFEPIARLSRLPIHDKMYIWYVMQFYIFGYSPTWTYQFRKRCDLITWFGHTCSFRSEPWVVYWSCLFQQMLISHCGITSSVWLKLNFPPCFLSVCQSTDNLFTPPRNRWEVIFSLHFVCEWVWQWTKFQPNTGTDFDTVFAIWLLTTLARVISIFSSLFAVNFPTLYFTSLMLDQNENRYIA